MLRELFLYDIASAYPSAMLLLPSMRDGKWVANSTGIFAKAIIEGSNILSPGEMEVPSSGFQRKEYPFQSLPL